MNKGLLDLNIRSSILVDISGDHGHPTLFKAFLAVVELLERVSVVIAPVIIGYAHANAINALDLNGDLTGHSKSIPNLENFPSRVTRNLLKSPFFVNYLGIDFMFNAFSLLEF